MARKKKSEGLQINFPPNIHQLALDFCRTRLNEEELERLSQLKREKERKRERAFRLQNGLESAKQIFLWAKAFRNSEIGQELMKKSHMPTAYRSVMFYGGQIEGTDWVGLGNTAEGLFLDRGGRMSALTRQIIKSAFDLALAVDPRALQDACKWIDNGKVWEYIISRFGYLAMRYK